MCKLVTGLLINKCKLFSGRDRQKQGHLCRCCQIEVLYIHLKQKIEITQFNTEAILFRPIDWTLTKCIRYNWAASKI